MVNVYEDQPSFGQIMGRGLGGNISSFLSEGLKEKFKNKREEKLSKKFQEQFGFDLPEEARNEFYKSFGQSAGKNQGLYEQLIEMGIDPQEASLYSKLTTGGQTQFAKDLLEGKKRGMSHFTDSALKPVKKLEGLGQEELQQPMEAEQKPDELAEYLSKQDQGLTPAEKVRRASERYKTGLPIAQEANTKLKTFTRDKERFEILKNLDSSKKLPKNFGRLNIDKDGNLRFPFASSPEAQRFVKTINEFSSGAKDTFGSRVTNFDLVQFLKRFPNLMNSSEGRKQIIQQMEVVNKINSVYYKNLKNILDKAGGVRNIDIDVAESLAEKASDPKIQQLAKKFSEIGNFPTLPSAQEHKGRKIKDEETGEVLESDGKNWNPVG